MATPYVLASLGTVGSTQQEARRRYDGRPVLVTAQRQTSGSGRHGRRWVHAPRAVAASLAFETAWPDDRLGLISLLAGLAARAAAGEEVRLEWPNDLVIGDRKVGGVLVEGDGALVIAGLGLNLWWPDPIEGAGAVLGVDPGPEAPEWLAEQWAGDLLEGVAAGPGAWDPAEYGRWCRTLGSPVTWEPGGSGTATGVAADGGLMVDTAEGPVTLHSGEVRRVRRVR